MKFLKIACAVVVPVAAVLTIVSFTISGIVAIKDKVAQRKVIEAKVSK